MIHFPLIVFNSLFAAHAAANRRMKSLIFYLVVDAIFAGILFAIPTLIGPNPVENFVTLGVITFVDIVCMVTVLMMD
jgi:hypothetical protein